MFFATKKENKGENNVCRFGLCFSLFPTKKENEGEIILAGVMFSFDSYTKRKTRGEEC